MSKQSAVIIVNPIAGGFAKEELLAYLMSKLESRFVLSVLYTKGKGDASLFARHAVENKVDLVIVIGGDGSVNEVAQSLIGSPVKLGIVPVGSGNGIARHARISLNSTEAIDTICRGYTTQVDAVRINERYFIGVAGIGFDAEVSWDFADYGKRGFLSYLFISCKRYRQYLPHSYHLVIDGEKMIRKAFLIAFANTSQFGNGAKIAPAADMTDGLLDVVIVPPFSFWEGVRLVYQLFRGTLFCAKRVEHFLCKKAEIIEPMIKAHLDGEPALFKQQVQLEIIPSALHLIV